MSSIPDYLVASGMLTDTGYGNSCIPTRGYGSWCGVSRIPLRGYVGHSQVVTDDTTFTVSPEKRTWTPLDLANRTWVAT